MLDQDPYAGHPPPASATEHRQARQRLSRSKSAVNWLVIVFGGLYFCFHAGFVVWHAVHNRAWLMQIVRDHYAALIGLPFVAFGAVCLVLFLDSRSVGDIEFKGLGFEFKGASGPIVLWALCFLVISVCFKLLWNP